MRPRGIGPIARSETRAQVVDRMLALMRQARGHGCDLVVFPELALTTFFPRWALTDEAEIDSFYEKKMPGPETKALFEESKKLGIGFYIGYAELAQEGLIAQGRVGRRIVQPGVDGRQFALGGFDARYADNVGADAEDHAHSLTVSSAFILLTACSSPMNTASVPARLNCSL